MVLVSRCEQWKVLIVNVKRGGRKDHEVARAMRRLGRPSRSGRHVLWSESGRRSPPSGFERWTNRLPARSLAPCVRIDRLFARRSRSDTTGGRPSVHEDGAADRTTFRTNALPHYGWERVGCVIFNRQLPATASMRRPFMYGGAAAAVGNAHLQPTAFRHWTGQGLHRLERTPMQMHGGTDTASLWGSLFSLAR